MTEHASGAGLDVRALSATHQEGESTTGQHVCRGCSLRQARTVAWPCEVAQLGAECDRLRAALDKQKLAWVREYAAVLVQYREAHKGWEQERARLQAALAAAQARAAALEQALREYGRHLSGCPRFLHGQGCECGWEQAQALTAPPAEGDRDA